MRSKRLQTRVSWASETHEDSQIHTDRRRSTIPIEDVYAQIREFAAESGARKVVLFGSRAKGTNRPKSDIDLTVTGCPDFDSPGDRLRNDLWSLPKVDAINLDDPTPEPMRTERSHTGKALYEKEAWPVGQQACATGQHRMDASPQPRTGSPILFAWYLPQHAPKSAKR